MKNKKLLRIVAAIVIALFAISTMAYGYFRFYAPWCAKIDLVQICDAFEEAVLRKNEDSLVVSAETARKISASLKHVSIVRSFAAMSYVSPEEKLNTFKAGVKAASGETWNCSAADQYLK